MRKRILFVGEASYLATGFANYHHELLSRLHKLDKYEIAELGAYAEDGDPRNHSVQWKFYPNSPNSQNQAEVDAYNSRTTNQFGEWRFEKTCLEFKPHIICDVRDIWMYEHQERSPFRPYFKWILMPTVDSAPQDEQWISTYLNADAILTYSEFGHKTLCEESSGLIHPQGMACPGVNLEDFPFVEDKAKAKAEIGLPEDCLIIGTVMRNQERKLYPDLMEAFAKFIAVNTSEAAKKTYLYLHTGYPDVGWKIPKYLKEFGIAHKVLFTYICHNCGAVFPSFYQDARAVCKNCGGYTASLPGVQFGTTRTQLGKIMGLFDIYVQYAICEGFGIPLIEAAATGSICLAVDYSAMSDIIKEIRGYPLAVQRFFYDSKTYAKRALPDNEHLVAELNSLLSLPKDTTDVIRKQSREAVEKYYSWDTTCKVWENCLDNIDVIPEKQSWQAPSRITQPVSQIPGGLSNEQFVKWAIINIAGRPELLDNYIALRMTRDLNWEASQTNPAGLFFNEASWPGLQPKWTSFSRQDVINELVRACEQKNIWEKERLATCR